MTFIIEIEEGGPLPQIIMDSMDMWKAEGKPMFTPMMLDRLRATGCYEWVGKFPYHIESPHNYDYRQLFRVTKQCEHRVIKRGYYRNNKSLGKAIDFDRALTGYNSPYKSQVDAIKS